MEKTQITFLLLFNDLRVRVHYFAEMVTGIQFLKYFFYESQV